MNTLTTLVDDYREKADELELLGATVEGDDLFRRIAQEIEAAVERYWNEELTLTEAAAESGYSKDHLGRLVREGIVPNAGQANRPRIRRRDLPRKPGFSAGGCAEGTTPVGSRAEMARSVVESQRGGHDG